MGREAEKLALNIGRMSYDLGYTHGGGRKLRTEQVVFVAKADVDVISESILNLPIIFSREYGVDYVNRYSPVWPVVLFSSHLGIDPNKLLTEMMRGYLLGKQEDGLPNALFSDLSRETCYPYGGFAGEEGGENLVDILTHDWMNNGQSSWTPVWIVAEYFYHSLISRASGRWPINEKRVHIVK